MAKVTARCDHCRKPLRAGRGIAGPNGTQFDSAACRKGYVSAAQLRGLQNNLRVARTRFKAAAISRAGGTYRNLGGQNWALVEQLLRSLL